ncbi:MAG: PDZ domain-containing protein [Phycisphaerales bacterium]|jgi:tricorn protease-like protein/C-terminal processing protease CtpA/Prc|nr:PDZ domain-containing protein [Phycisphaerales bacterium]
MQSSLGVVFTISAMVLPIGCAASSGTESPSPAGLASRAGTPAASPAARKPDANAAGMMRYPDISSDSIVFLYANDLWIVPREGGVARPLASPPGSEIFPRFSPDGQTIAFLGNYDGGADLYAVPVSGGVPQRLTWHPAAEVPSDWTPDGRVIFASNGLAGLQRQQQLFTVGLDGAAPAKLPPAYGADGSISADGKWLAYLPHQRDFRTWKRYRGGMASDIWLMNLDTLASERITDWEGTDTFPMWQGSKVYYLSDQGDGSRLNIWSYDTTSKRREQVTTFKDFDVKFPAMGPGPSGAGEIVFQYGPDLVRLDLRDKSTHTVSVEIPGAKPKLRPQEIDAANNIASGGISSTGKRAVAEARGDLWTIPAEHGAIRQLTDTDGVAERSPAWSPDGRWIAYFSDKSGEYELYLMQSDGKGETRQLTSGNKTYFFGAGWSPDSKKLVLVDKAGQVWLVDVESGDAKVIDKDPWGYPASPSWSHDSKWLTYQKQNDESGTSAVWIYSLDSGEAKQVTSGFFNDSNPVFSRTGDYLYYTSQRNFTSPMYEDVGTTFVYAGTGRLIAVPLNDKVENKGLIKSDEETWEKDKDAKDGEKKDEDKKDGAKKEDGEKDDAQGDDENDAASDEKDASGDEQPAGEEDIYANFQKDHALFGKWECTASGLKAVGLPEDTLDFVLTIIVDKDGNISGTSEAQGEKESLGDVVNWDPATNELRREREQNGITSISKGTVSGDEMTGTWEIKPLGFTGTWTGKRTTRDLTKEELGDAAEKSGKKKDEPLEINFEGFESRGIELPVENGNFANLVTNDKGNLIYMRLASRGQQVPPAVKIFDITADEPEEKTVVAGAGLADISGDGKKLLVAAGSRRWAIVSAAAGQSLAKAIEISGMTKTLDPREEWRQLVRDAWRRQRDFLYVDNMHGVDWDAIYEQYAAMVDHASSREDVGYIIAEMISELNIGHAYYGGGDVEIAPSKNVGLLGVDWEVASEGDGADQASAWRIARLVHGGPWDSDARGPLNELGLGVKEGTFVLAVNGRRLDPDRDPYSAFIGLAGKDVTLTIADALTGDEKARNERDITIEPISSEAALRYRAWVEHNRARVEEASGGKIGYIHVPDTGVNGQNELFRQFYGQIGKAALIIDDRWNGGGQIPTRFIELLNRPRTNYWARRDGKDWPWPPDSHQGPKAMLINGLAGSGGDMFPWLFRFNKLGKLIGTRTWGGLVGISGVPGLIDGANVTVPNFGFYEKDGTWGVEGHGVDPDIEVIDNPTEIAKGNDPQLDAAITHLLREIELHPYTPPKRPASPQRAGMGIPDEDK